MNKHFNFYLHKILEIIKSSDRKFTFKEVENKCGIKLATLITALKDNPRIQIENGKIYYNPEFLIRTKEDVINILKEKNEGIEMDRLNDGPIDVRQIMGIVEKKPQQIGVKKRTKITLPPIVTNEFIILRDLDGGEIVFLNETIPNLPPEGESLNKIKTLWNNISVPNYQTVLEHLNKAGVKTTPEISKKQGIVKQEKTKKFKRKFKITNTHIKELNLDNLNENENY